MRYTYQTAACLGTLMEPWTAAEIGGLEPRAWGGRPWATRLGGGGGEHPRTLAPCEQSPPL